jgi:uncharacterized protein YjbI with pentapeptide repeats
MKTVRYLFIGAILGGLIGWGAGYLRLPYIERSLAFWVGCVVGLSLFALVIAAVFAWNRNVMVSRLLGRVDPAKEHVVAARSHALIWILVASFILFGGVASTVMIYRQNARLAADARQQNRRIAEQTEVIESIRKSNMALLVSNLLDDVNDELESSTNRTLSDGTVARIAALSLALRPYRYMVGRRLSEQPLSPERGQLLMALARMEMDTASFALLLKRVSFAHADLGRADLSGLNLRTVDLRSAHLVDADLTKAILDSANLADVNMNGADLRQSSLKAAHLERADLSWTDLRSASFALSNMDGVTLEGARAQRSDLAEASIRYARLNGALLSESNLESAVFFMSEATKVGFNGANLNQADLRKVSLSDADLTDAQLNGVLVQEEDWLQRLDDWKTIGGAQVRNRYRLIIDATGLSKHTLESITP